MNISRNLKDFPDPYILRQRLLAYCIIDITMNVGSNFLNNVYCCHNDWRGDGVFFSINDGSDDHFNVVFSKEGCIVKGFAHESDLSPYNYLDADELPDFKLYDKAPAALLNLLDDPALEKEWVTFCAWQAKNDDWQWAKANIAADKTDGSDLFLEWSGSLDVYAAWFSEYYDTELDFEVAEQILNGYEVTADMVKALNPETPVAKALEAIDKVRFAAQKDLVPPAEVLPEPPVKERIELKPEKKAELVSPQLKPPQPAAFMGVSAEKPAWFREEPQWIKDVLDK